jgi:hypothetical protein
MNQQDIDQFEAVGTNSEARKLFALEFFVREKTLFEERKSQARQLTVEDRREIEIIRRSTVNEVRDTWRGVCRICARAALKGDKVQWRKGLGWVHVDCKE